MRVDKLFEEYNRPGSPGVAVAVIKNGEVIYKKGYGYAQLEYDVPITPSTIFHIASISKQFTCFAITHLQAGGKLCFDDDVRKFLPYVPDFGHSITIRHLMHHVSGLRDQWELFRLAGWRMDDVITQEHVVKMVTNQQALNFTPGSEFLYCNTGYTLLAEIVKAVSGMSLRQYCEKHIFRPLGMSSTHFHDDHEEIVRGRAYSYAPTETGFRKSVLSYANVGATSLFTTVEDLAKWVVNFDTREIGGNGALENMFNQFTLANGETIPYMFGLNRGEYRGLKHVGHTGSDAGFRTACFCFTEQGFSVIIFGNLSTLVPSGMALKIADIYLAEQFLVPQTEEEIDCSAVRRDVDITPYVGEYLISYVGVVIDVRRQGNKLVAQIGDQPSSELIPCGEDKFLHNSLKVTVTALRDETGKVTKLSVPIYGAPLMAKRLEPMGLTAAQLAEYAGSFYSEELGTQYSLVPEDGGLTLTHRRHEDIALVATGKDVFEARKRAGMFSFVRENGCIVGFRLTGSRVRELEFCRR